MQARYLVLGGALALGGALLARLVSARRPESVKSEADAGGSAGQTTKSGAKIVFADRDAFELKKAAFQRRGAGKLQIISGWSLFLSLDCPVQKAARHGISESLQISIEL